MDIEPRLNDIFFSSKMGHGVGKGSPALTPRLTSRLSERTLPPLALGLLLATASLAPTGIAVDLYVVVTVLVPAWTVSLDSNEAIVMRSAYVDCLRHGLQVLRITAHLVVAQVVNDQVAWVAHQHHVGGSVRVL
jgi:hypothetical protein